MTQFFLWGEREEGRGKKSSLEESSTIGKDNDCSQKIWWLPLNPTLAFETPLLNDYNAPGK